MRKNIKIIVIILLVLLAFIASTLVDIRLSSKHAKVAEGTYKIQDNIEYPKAYLVVKDGKAQFFNIDLNALYKDNMAGYYIDYLKAHNPQFSDEDEQEARDSIDLNKMFCESAFPLNYDQKNSNFIDKKGIAHYNFGWVTEVTYLSYKYDWKEKTVTLDQEGSPYLVFQR